MDHSFHTPNSTAYFYNPFLPFINLPIINSLYITLFIPIPPFYYPINPYLSLYHLSHLISLCLTHSSSPNSSSPSHPHLTLYPPPTLSLHYITLPSLAHTISPSHP